jgi:hypothetical protein
MQFATYLPKVRYATTNEGDRGNAACLTIEINSSLTREFHRSQGSGDDMGYAEELEHFQKSGFIVGQTALHGCHAMLLAP